jgi:DNA-binding transcriptional ArsR family regulator
MNVFQALADPTRRAIVALLAPGERSAGEIGAEFSISCPAVSQHLKALREAGLVSVRIDAQRRIYQLNPAGFAELKAWLFRIHSIEGGRSVAAAAAPLAPSPTLCVAARVQARRVGADFAQVGRTG